MKRHHIHLSVALITITGALVLYFVPRQVNETPEPTVDVTPPLVQPPEQISQASPNWPASGGIQIPGLPTLTTDEPTPATAPEPLPSLDESDEMVKSELAALTPDQTEPFWLESRELVRRMVMLTDNIAHGSVPRRYFQFLAPDGAFKVQKAGETLTIDPASYQRYTPLAEGIASVSPAAAATLYRRLSPLFDAAYRELGIPGSFSASLTTALDHLLATPVPDSAPELLQPKIMYAYADPALEGLSAAQKQLLRMGPENAEAVKRQLRALAAAIGLELTSQ
ncbi:MAG: DUF3014 domain-containing protein [Gammaproteobacteria bacterium]|nr:DUF3014 domain-containing protein [Gammaproteobacteria bacterium]